MHARSENWWKYRVTTLRAPNHISNLTIFRKLTRKSWCYLEIRTRNNADDRLSTGPAMLKSALPQADPAAGGPPKYASITNAVAHVAPTGMSHDFGKRFRSGIAVGNSHRKMYQRFRSCSDTAKWTSSPRRSARPNCSGLINLPVIDHWSTMIAVRLSTQLVRIHD